VGTNAAPGRRLRRLGVVGLVWLVVLAALYAAAAALPPRAPFGPGYHSLPKLPPRTAKSGVDPRLSRVASVLARRMVDVYCWSTRDWVRSSPELTRWTGGARFGPWRGFTTHYPLAIHLSPEVCTELTLLRQRPASRWSDEPEAAAWAVGALAHESMHVRGLGETGAHCYGMQLIDYAAYKLGRTMKEGEHLAVVFWKRWYRFSEPPYFSPDCRKDGRLDARPGTPAWPY
jgi:hypothetical protein